MMDGEIEANALVVSDRVMSRWKRAMIAPSNSLPFGPWTIVGENARHITWARH